LTFSIPIATTFFRGIPLPFRSRGWRRGNSSRINSWIFVMLTKCVIILEHTHSLSKSKEISFHLFIITTIISIKIFAINIYHEISNVSIFTLLQ
jgi:hypothetical protein